MKSNPDDTFLARWLNNELSEEELKDFEATEDFIKYQKIIAASDNILPADFDDQQILEHINSRKTVRSLSATPRYWYGIAAAVLLLVGFFISREFLFSGNVMHRTDFGEQTQLALPDGSMATLNARSELKYSKGDWSTERSLQLTGEAFFEVKTGAKFSVHSENGKVEVLGTRFNVISRDGFFEVACFEGSVRVSNTENDKVLTPGKTWRQIDGIGGLYTEEKGNQPSWLAGETSFREVPLHFVLRSIENQYDVRFQGEGSWKFKTYSGTFPHDDLTVALQLVLGSLQIDYQFKGEKSIVLQD